MTPRPDPAGECADLPAQAVPDEAEPPLIRARQESSSQEGKRHPSLCGVCVRQTLRSTANTRRNPRPPFAPKRRAFPCCALHSCGDHAFFLEILVFFLRFNRFAFFLRLLIPMWFLLPV